jgi:hypothetical protein
MRGKFLLCMLVCLPLHALAKQETLPRACSQSLDERLPGWRFHESPADAAAWAALQGLNPVVTAGDFNGDGKKDWAALVTASGSTVVAACLSQGRRVRIVLIENTCDDMLFRMRAGRRVPNLETDRVEKLRRDAIATSCFEKAGITHVYERGAFRSFMHA